MVTSVNYYDLNKGSVGVLILLDRGALNLQCECMYEYRELSWFVKLYG